MKTQYWFVKTATFLALLSLIAACSPRSANVNPQEIETMLIAKEQQKWDMFSQGNFAAVSELYADDFINVGFTPTGMVRQNKKDAFDMLAQVPPMPGEISLTDFLVVHGDDHSAVVSYKVAVPFGNLYVSSVWVERNGDWKTVFYQASPDSSPASPVSATDAVPFSGLFKMVDASHTDAILFNSDGTYAIDAGATGIYGTTGHLEFNGNLVIFTDDEASPQSCQGDMNSGTYQYTLTGNSITFTVVDDKCLTRTSGLTQGSWTK